MIDRKEKQITKLLEPLSIHPTKYKHTICTANIKVAVQICGNTTTLRYLISKQDLLTASFFLNGPILNPTESRNPTMVGVKSHQ